MRIRGTSLKTQITVCALLGLVLPFVGCGGSSTGSTPPEQSNISVTVNPPTASVVVSQNQQFSAVVKNTSNQAVTWKVNGVDGGNATVGTISNVGLYTAPVQVPTDAVTVSAMSVADNTKSGTATVTIQGQAYSGVLTYHNDAGITGQNLNETVLTPANVNVTHFGKLFSHSLDAQSFTQPLYVRNVPINGQGTHNVVYVTTEHDSVYAFDADSDAGGPLWLVNFTNSGAGVTTIPKTGTESPISPEVGITGTPVIDGNSGTLYVVAATRENGTDIHRLHALDITNGSEKFGGPVLIQASVPGSGTDSVGGQLNFNATYELQRSGLLLSNGVVYIAWASYNDMGPYHGWIIGYDASTLAQVRAWNATPNGERGGIWMSGASPSVDSAGQIFLIAGNGTFDANNGGSGYGDTFLKLAADGNSFRVNDYFTPFNQQMLADEDIDVGSSGFTLLPDQPGAFPHLAISAGKEGTIYSINRDQMGKFQTGSDSQIVQVLPLALGTQDNDNDYSTATYWQGNIYFIGNNDVVKQFKLTDGMLSVLPVSQGSHVYGYPGANMSISANGVSDAILWSIEASGVNVLHAYDASNVATEFYNSGQATGGRDQFGTAIRFSVPTIVNGKVYVAGKTDFTAFGLF